MNICRYGLLIRTSAHFHIRTFAVSFLFVSLAFAGGNVFAQSFKSAAELTKQADKDFKKEDYAAALPLYSQLLSLNQKDALLNYRYGICLLMADKDKTSSYNFLEFASRDAKIDEDVFYYIGRSLQLKYRFDDAIASYKDFIKWVGAGTAKKFDTEHQIETCKNAKELVRTRTNVTVKGSREVSANAVYGAYELQASGGKFLATSEKYVTNIDKRKITNPIMFLSADGLSIYFTSYGRTEDNGKDIYVVRKQASGGWGVPKSLGPVVNSTYDEDYPFLDADGKTLYFSSKGHNSMGGYDMFKTTYNAAADEWSKPENMGATINSPDDDFFYMPVQDGVAQFASTKETAKGMVKIYTIEVASSQKVLAAIHGRYKSMDQTRADGKISVLRKSDKGLVATTRTDQKTGDYELSLPTGEDYEIVVEGGGYLPHVEDFSLPQMDHSVSIKQEVTMDRNKDAEKLEIRNQYLQGDSTLAASSSVPKDPAVIKDEFKAGDMNKENLQAFNVGGQVVYATPPSAKTTEPVDKAAAVSTEKKSAAADAAAVNTSSSGVQKDVNKTENPASQTATDINSSVKTAEKESSSQITAGTNASEEKKQVNTTEDKKDAVSADAQKEKVTTAVAATEKTEDKKSAAETKTEKKENTAVIKKSKDEKNAAADDEMVQTAFNDAKELDEEAKEIVAQAKSTSASASKKDSLSKLQLSQSVDALKSGDEGNARELTRQSQLNADSAQKERALAHELDGEAKEKQAEANKALADAKELQKNTSKNNSGKLAKNESKKKKKEESLSPSLSKVEGAAPSAGKDLASGKDSKEMAANKESNSAGEQKEAELAKKNSANEAAATGGSKSNEVAKNDVTAVKSATQPETANANNGSVTKDKGQGAAAKSTVSADVAENKSGVAVNTPATSEETKKQAEKLKEKSIDFQLQSESLKETVKKSNDQELNKKWTEQANSLADSAKVTSKEADKLFALAKDLKNKEAKNGGPSNQNLASAADKKTDAAQFVTKNADESKKEAGKVQIPVVANSTVSGASETPAGANDAAAADEKKTDAANSASSAAESKEAASKKTPAVVTAKPGETEFSVKASKENAAEQPTAKPDDSAAAQERKSDPSSSTIAAEEPKETASEKAPVVVTAKPGETEFSAKTTKENAAKDEAKPEGAKQAEASAPVAEDAKTAELVKSVAPEAVAPYKEYLRTKQESEAQSKQADDLQARVANMPPSAERDKLVQQSNDLNLQSIKTWQQAQVKLNEAKQADPAVETKLKDAHFAEIKPAGGKSSETKDNGSLASAATSSNANSTGDKTTTSGTNTNNDRLLSPEEMERVKQKDSLMSQAVTHRVMAENAGDSATEKSELQKTKQLIAESNNPGTTSTSKAAVTSKPVGKPKDNSTTSLASNEDSKSSAVQPAAPAEKKSAPTAKKKETAVANSKTVETPAGSSNSAEKTASTTTAKNASSPAAASESASEANTASAVLEAKSLVVNESEVFSITPKQSYSATNPVPMDPQLPEGLVFKVQIGAFHNPLPPESFKNVQPLTGETTRAGWIRYCVGLFRTFEPANLVKMQMRSAGYKDAFVVAYYNGKRISLFDAYSIINRSGTSEKKLYADASEKESNHLSGMNIKASDFPMNNDPDASSFYGTSASASNTDEAAIEYAVQVGVYKSGIVPKKLQALIPLNSELYRNNLYRFTTGHFSLRAAADSMRQVAVNTGVKDAFVIIYKKGNNVVANTASAAGSKSSAAETQASASNNEITFKVQVGAYRTELPEAKLNSLKTQYSAELSQSLSASGLHIIYAGSFKDYNQALALKNQLAAKGVKDAFVAAFSGDTKISIQKALIQGGKQQ